MKSLSDNLRQEFHPHKNVTLSVDQVSAGSPKKVWWLGKCGHEWEATPNSRSRGSRCPYCINKKVLAGFNDLRTKLPSLAEEWHPVKNGSALPDDFVFGSRSSVWWLAPCGHEWEAVILDRYKGSGCLFCSGQKVLTGFNDLGTFYPNLMKEWDYAKNFPLTPYDVTTTSGKKVWWIGKCGHEWEAVISHRSKRAHGCNICSRKLNGKFLSTPKDGSSIASKYPELIDEWHPTKNGLATPDSVSSGSNTVIHWICSKNHEWEAPAYTRTGTIRCGCPTCARKSFVSGPQLEICNFVKSLGLEVEVSNRNVLPNGQEIDIWVPAKKVGIEFNGIYWHTEDMGKTKDYHHKKWFDSNRLGIQLLQIWEDDWRTKKNIVLRMIASKLGKTAELGELFPDLKNTTEKIYARKTSLKTLSTKEARTFLEENHLQGFASGSYYYGLADKDETVRALIVLKKDKENVLDIVRYATSGSVIGGFTKLLTFARKKHNPTAFITFADHCVSDGKMYLNNGFTQEKEITPDYMYLVGRIRKHKFGYRLARFRNDDSLIWQEGLSERELAALNNLRRIWDAGKTKYRLECK